jgi:hypothetical protein
MEQHKMTDTIEKLSGMLVYVQLETPKPCFDPLKGVEWKASIVVDEDTADKWDEQFPKQAAKQIKTDGFEALYKVKPPYPEQRKQYIITLRKNTKLGNGKEVPPMYQPKVFLKKGSKAIEITHSTLVANGSKGQISVDAFEGKMGMFARLKNVLVTDLIEYVRTEQTLGDEFGLDVEAEAPKPQKAKELPGGEFDDDPDLPF